jgi:hypothetical protein
LAALTGLPACACKARETSSAPALTRGSVEKSAATTRLQSEQTREPVGRVALDKLDPAVFADDELDLPYYLAHFSTVANAVEVAGANRGFININVWRGKVDVHNARLMENVLSLAWFYTQKREWNPYYAAPELRARIEAALRFWTASQAPDGQFSEYEPGIFGLAPTAFATKFFGEALILLRSGPPLDRDVLEAAEDCLAKAVRVTLSAQSMYATGRSFTNQFGNVWGGGLALLSFRPDAELRSLWEQRFVQSRADFQSPAGFYYEADGPDFEYTLNTHHHSLRQAWEWLRGTPLGKDLSEREAAWAEWLALNAVPEPGGAFALNAAIATRKTLTSFRRYDSPIGEVVPLLRAFGESVEELSARRKMERARLVATWPRVEPLAVGEFSAYSPYVFLHRRLQEWRPNATERDAARAKLPVLARERFTVQRRDSRKKATFTYVRRPTYYATFATGERAVSSQRYGLGLVWSARLGTVLMSQPASDRLAWGTLSASKQLYEAGDLNAEFRPEGTPLDGATPAHRELPSGTLESRYPLGTAGQKRVKFGDASIVVGVEHGGTLEELLPLLVPDDGNVSETARAVTLTTSRGRFVIRLDAGVTASVEPQPISILHKKLVIVRLQARSKLGYSLSLE